MCTSSPSSRAFCAVRRGTHAHEATSAQGTRSRANSLGRPETKTTAVTVVCWSGICGLGSIEIGSLGPINTLPFDHKSGSPESLVSLLPDINKPPVRMATATHATRPRTRQRPRKVVAGVEARGLISPAARLRLCSLDSIVTTPLYRTIVSRALRRSFSELNRADHAHHKEGRS